MILRRALGVRLSDDDRARALRALSEIETEQREREAAARVERTLAMLMERGLAAYVELDEGRAVA